jgi:hypothetical protein
LKLPGASFDEFTQNLPFFRGANVAKRLKYSILKCQFLKDSVKTNTPLQSMINDRTLLPALQFGKQG